MQEWNMAIAMPLSGSQQTPAVDTDATGIAAFWPMTTMIERIGSDVSY
jgi:hypothetical protein